MQYQYVGKLYDVSFDKDANGNKWIRLESPEQDIVIQDEMYEDMGIPSHECQEKFLREYIAKEIGNKNFEITNYIDGEPVNRDNLFDRLLDLFGKHIEASDLRTEEEIKEQILQFIDTNKDIDFQSYG